MGKINAAIQSLVRRAAGAYIAGPSIEHVRTACEELAHRQIATTVCRWHIDPENACSIWKSYLALLDLIATMKSDSYLSIKAPSLQFDFDFLRTILIEAHAIGAIVHFDAMAHDTVDRTFELIGKASEIHTRLGYTLPARWKRSVNDASRAAAMRLRVRVVKGEWPGPGDDETDPLTGYLHVIERLVSAKCAHVAVATHNLTIARKAFSLLQRGGISCELELLYGLPREQMLRLARSLGIRARVYVPYGTAGLPYRLRHTFRNPRIAAWFVHDLMRGFSPTAV